MGDEHQRTCHDEQRRLYMKGEDLARYDAYVSDSTGGDFGAYSRNRQLGRIFDRLPPRLRVLDIGGGPCIVAAELVARGHDVTVVDRSPAVATAATRCGAAHVVADVGGRLRELGRFDVVLLLDIIEHLFDSSPVLTSARDALDDGGTLVVSCPNSATVRARLHYVVRGYPMRTEGDPVPPWRYHHIRYFTPRTLTQRMTELGFVLERWNASSESRWVDRAARLFPTLFGDTLLAVFQRRGTQS